MISHAGPLEAISGPHHPEHTHMGTTVCRTHTALALAMDAWEPISGVIVMDKPERASSAGMCRLVKGRMRAAGAPKSVKVGHGGTLDPLATGLVVILVGKATKRSDEVMAGEKEYLVGVDLSAFTASDDRETERAEVAVETPPTIERIREAAAGFVGAIEQVPPAHSAIWVDGRRSYKLVRAGEAVELAARRIEVHEIRVLAYDWPIVTLAVRCGKGVYIRSLARDLGVVLGTGGTLAWLRRTRIGRWSIRDAVTPDRVPDPLGASGFGAIAAEGGPDSAITRG